MKKNKIIKWLKNNLGYIFTLLIILILAMLGLIYGLK